MTTTSQKDLLPYSGRVAIIGKPNVGKSTLLNGLLDKEVSIITRKAHTTQKQILAVKHNNNAELIFIDTPGLCHKKDHCLHQYMGKTMTHAITDADIIVYLTNLKPLDDEDKKLCQQLKQANKPILLAINKLDLKHTEEQVTQHSHLINELLPLSHVIPLSAKIAFNLHQLEACIIEHLPQKKWAYPNNDHTDQKQEKHAEQIIRKCLLENLHQEIPYQLAVVVSPFKTIKKHLHIEAKILVNKTSHKGMVIGKQGQTLKHIGSVSRTHLESWLNQKVHLKLWVKVESDWLNKPDMIAQTL
jgi:GTPase